MTTKSVAQYLSAAGGDAEAALRAMHADLAAAHDQAESEAGSNIRARVISKALEPLADALGLQLPEPGRRPSQEAQGALEQAVKEVIGGLQQLEAGRDLALDLLAQAGLDVDALQQAESDEARGELVTNWLGSIDSVLDAAENAAAQLNVYRFAHEHGLDPKLLLLQKGAEHLEEREIEVERDGQPVKEKVWGIPGDGDTFTPAAEHFRPVLEALNAQPQPSGWTVRQDSITQPQPVTAQQLDLSRAATGDYSI